MDDWSALLHTRPNMLIVGPSAAAAVFIGAVTPHLQSPVRSLVCGAFSPHLPTDGSLILRDVDVLDGDQQQSLVRWLDQPQTGRPQVISVTTAPLYNLVQAGMFLDQLYYRLNVVHFEVVSD